MKKLDQRRLTRLFKRLLIIIIALASLGFSYAPMDGLKISYLRTDSGQISFLDKTYKYRMDIYTGQLQPLPGWVQKLDIEQASLFILNEARRIGLPTNQCFPLESFDLLFIEKTDLENRFISYGVYPSGTNLFGVFDALKGQSEDAKMFIANDISTRDGVLTFTHELTHYWYDRLCWGDATLMSSEALALHMEKIYSEIR